MCNLSTGIALSVFSITFFQQFHTVIIIWKIQPPADRLSENLFSFFGIFYLIIMFRPVFEGIDLGGFFFFQKHREVLSLVFWGMRNSGKVALNCSKSTKFSKTRFRYVSLVAVLRSQSRLMPHLPSKCRPLPSVFSSFC